MQNLRERENLSSPIMDRLTEGKVELGGVIVKCVASNVRRLDIPWNSYGLVYGKGMEGNLVVVEATTSYGFRTEVENQQGRDERIYQGDRFVAVLANRHSGTSESGDIPAAGIDIQEGQELHLLSAGGVVGIKSGMPGRGQEPLVLKPLGLVADHDKPVDLIKLSGGHHEVLGPSARIIMVCGTSAEVGKTTTAAGLIRAFSGEGLQVAATKFSGTGRLRDILSLRDAGALPWSDFPDVGLATTYTNSERFTRGVYTLFNRVNAGNPGIIIAEAGGDPIEANVPTFLQNLELMKNVEAIVLVAGDVMGMMGSIAYLRKYATDIPMFLTDPKGRNPVTTRERVRHELPGIPIFNSLNPLEVRDVAKQILISK
ncbi:hypothetical protein HYW41_04860 [Candidatus Daviesbacteria bacterium]|nr:hypothetical protein [Candidatus Daviesbacteria bacterium]